MYDRVKSAQEYLKNKKILKDRYEAERSGDIQLFRDQEKILKPLIVTQQDTSKASQENLKAIKDEIIASKDTTSQALVPLARELQRRNDQFEMLQGLPFNQSEIELSSGESTPEKKDQGVIIDLDGDLTIDDIYILEQLGFDRPSIVYAKNNYDETIKKIKTVNKSIGQHLGKSSKKSEKEKKVFEDQKLIFKKYRDLVERGQQGKVLIAKPKSKGQGLQSKKCIFYNNPQGLCEKLKLLDAEKEAGNTGVDNDINSILDELLKIGQIDKTTFDKLYKNIFV